MATKVVSTVQGSAAAPSPAPPCAQDGCAAMSRLRGPKVSRPQARTIGDGLLQRRLAHREARLELVLRALYQRLHETERHGDAIPAPLVSAISDFEHERAEVRRNLRALRREVAPDR